MTLNEFIKRKVEIEQEISTFIAERVDEIQGNGVNVKNITISNLSHINVVETFGDPVKRFNDVDVDIELDI